MKQPTEGQQLAHDAYWIGEDTGDYDGVEVGKKIDAIIQERDALRAEVERLQRVDYLDLHHVETERAALRAKLAAVDTIASPALPGGEYAEGWNACVKLVRAAIREEKP